MWHFPAFLFPFLPTLKEVNLLEHTHTHSSQVVGGGKSNLLLHSLRLLLLLLNLILETGRGSFCFHDFILLYFHKASELKNIKQQADAEEWVTGEGIENANLCINHEQ